MIHVFLCQSRKETHVEIGEMHISPILYEIYIPTLQLSILLNRELDGLSFRMKLEDRYTRWRSLVTLNLCKCPGKAGFLVKLSS